MINKKTPFFAIVLCCALLAAAFVSGRAFSETVMPPPQAGTVLPVSAAAENPLMVTGIIVDKTDKNSAVAKELAIVEAQRTAFRMLAERSLAPEVFKVYQLPDDKTILLLVQDFEIKDEQISASRYVATFTVRFNEGIYGFLKIPADAKSIVVAPAPEASAPPAVSSGPRDVLVLPYFEDISGVKRLWEDPNPWREAWQATGNLAPAPGLTIAVPLGDIADISAGSTDAVWSGDYSVVEKLRTNYNASEVALTVANKSGIHTRVELYIYKDGKLDRKKPVTPYTSEEDAKNAFNRTVTQVIQAIQTSEPYAEPVAAPVEKMFKEPPEPEGVVTTVVEKPAEPPPPEKITLDVTSGFSAFTQWLEVQRRLASISPVVTVEIFSLNKTSSRFTLSFDGGMEAFQTALAGKGLAIAETAVTVEETIPGGAEPVKKTVYELKVVN